MLLHALTTILYLLFGMHCQIISHSPVFGFCELGAMAERYYFHLVDGENVIRDDLGAVATDLADRAATEIIDEFRRDQAQRLLHWQDWKLVVRTRHPSSHSSYRSRNEASLKLVSERTALLVGPLRLALRQLRRARPNGHTQTTGRPRGPELTCSVPASALPTAWQSQLAIMERDRRRLDCGFLIDQDHRPPSMKQSAGISVFRAYREKAISEDGQMQRGACS